MAEDCFAVEAALTGKAAEAPDKWDPAGHDGPLEIRWLDPTAGPESSGPIDWRKRRLGRLAGKRRIAPELTRPLPLAGEGASSVIAEGEHANAFGFAEGWAKRWRGHSAVMPFELRT